MLKDLRLRWYRVCETGPGGGGGVTEGQPRYGCSPLGGADCNHIEDLDGGLVHREEDRRFKTTHRGAQAHLGKFGCNARQSEKTGLVTPVFRGALTRMMTRDGLRPRGVCTPKRESTLTESSKSLVREISREKFELRQKTRAREWWRMVRRHTPKEQQRGVSIQHQHWRPQLNDYRSSLPCTLLSADLEIEKMVRKRVLDRRRTLKTAAPLTVNRSASSEDEPKRASLKSSDSSDDASPPKESVQKLRPVANNDSSDQVDSDDSSKDAAEKKSDSSQFSPSKSSSEEDWSAEDEKKPRASKKKSVRSATSKKRKFSSGKRARQTSKRGKRREEDVESDSSDESEYKSTRVKRRSKQRNRKDTYVESEESDHSEYQSSASEQESDDDDASWKHNNKSRFKTPVRGQRRSRRGKADSSEEEDQGEEHISPRRSTPARRSAARARARLKDDQAEDDDDDFVAVFPAHKKKSEDDEFDPDDEDDDDDEEDSILPSADDDDNVDGNNVDIGQDFLTAESSDDENPTGPSPILDIKYAPRRHPVPSEKDNFLRF